MGAESILPVIHGEDIRMAVMAIGMTTAQDSPRRAVIKQHDRERSGEDMFYLSKLHTYGCKTHELCHYHRGVKIVDFDITLPAIATAGLG